MEGLYPQNKIKCYKNFRKKNKSLDKLKIIEIINAIEAWKINSIYQITEQNLKWDIGNIDWKK